MLATHPAAAGGWVCRPVKGSGQGAHSIHCRPHIALELRSQQWWGGEESSDTQTNFKLSLYLPACWPLGLCESQVRSGWLAFPLGDHLCQPRYS